jgi:hypothetical protein
MATPLAAGDMALLRQYFTDGFYPTGTKVSANAVTPSAALLRATVVNGARSMEGFNSDGYPLEPPPSCRQGLTHVHFSAQPEPFLTQNAP